MSELISDKGVYRTSPATPGLLMLIILHVDTKRLSYIHLSIRGTLASLGGRAGSREQ